MTPDLPARPRLTRRLLRLLRLLGAGHGNQAIADRIGIHEVTVGQNIARLRRRLGARSTRHAITLGCAWGYIDAGAVAAGADGYLYV